MPGTLLFVRYQQNLHWQALFFDGISEVKSIHCTENDSGENEIDPVSGIPAQIQRLRRRLLDYGEKTDARQSARNRFRAPEICIDDQNKRFMFRHIAEDAFLLPDSTTEVRIDT
jgi:hypothetical protein